jgi:hypothetical protein
MAMRVAREMGIFELDGERFVRPDFGGRGLANLAPTVLRLLAPEAEAPALPPFDAQVLPERISGGVRHIVLLIADGLGHHQLMTEIEHGNAPHFAELLARAGSGEDGISYQAITSVFPTTTVSALGSVNSAVTPAEHGLLSYTIYLPELDTVADMIRWGPTNRRISFMDSEFNKLPEEFFWAPTVYARLQAAGVERTFAVNPSAFVGTALTRMLHQQATYRGYAATSSVAAIVPRLLADRSEPSYVYAYWPTVDTVAHAVGPRSDEHGAEVAALDTALAGLVRRLPATDDTLLLVSADHGHVDSAPEQQVSLDEHDELLAMLRAAPAGERRAVYLYAREGEEAAVVEYARERLGDVAVAITREHAIALGLFGPEPIAERARQRIGDVLLFPRGSIQLLATVRAPDGTPLKAPVFRGLHGGLTEDEALVPLLAMRL